jgi:TIR domain
MPPLIFISYRRDDSAGFAGRLAENLGRVFGRDRVFIDVHIPPGSDFVDAIERVVGSCDVLIAVIGRRWLTASDGDGRPRLPDPEDFLRQEIQTALSCGLQIVPALVDGATLPAPRELPSPLRPLLRHQAIQLTHEHWERDVAWLQERLQPRTGAARRRRALAAAGLAGALAAATAAVSILRHHAAAPNDLDRALGASRPAAIHGTVIDFRRRPLRRAAVRIGSAAANTDERGAFDLVAEAVPYDAVVTIDATYRGAPVTQTWTYVGLSRPDPTLQAYGGLPARSTRVETNVAGARPRAAAAADETTRALTMGFAGPDASFHKELLVPRTSFAVNWTGPAATQGIAHLLAWTRADWSSGSPPVDFWANESQPLALGPAPSALDWRLDRRPLPTETISGSVGQAAAGGDQESDTFVLFDDGAVIPLERDTRGPGPFTYRVPNLPHASIWLTAAVGMFSGPNEDAPFAVAHRSGLAAGRTDIALELPAPAVPLAPEAGARDVDASTEFRWTGGGPVSVLAVESVASYRSLFVVTASRRARLPAVASGVRPLSAGETYRWSVQTHGAFPSVDAAAGARGFLDPLSRDGEPTAPAAESGAFTRSARRSFRARAPISERGP